MPHRGRPEGPYASYLQSLARANGLGRVCFVAPEAMLFGTRKSWWGRRQARTLPHEGVDLCWYRTEEGHAGQLNPGSRVPVVCDGLVWAISDDDFIGHSIFVRHDGEAGVYFTAYAHVTPRPGLSEGDVLAGEEVLATLADPSRRSLSIASHLHLSLMAFSDHLPKEALRWVVMGAGTAVRFYDPAPLLGEALVLCGEADPSDWG